MFQQEPINCKRLLRKSTEQISAHADCGPSFATLMADACLFLHFALLQAVIGGRLLIHYTL